MTQELQNSNLFVVVVFRSSVYQSKAARSDIARFKMPATLKSPPGAKTRSRRTSVYQKGGKSLLSPGSLPVSSRTRRTSIYIRGTNADNEFSKVFRTPMKPVEQVKSVAEENELPTIIKVSPNKIKAKTPIMKDSPSLLKSSKKAVAAPTLTEVQSPKSLKKTPASKPKSPKSLRSAKTTVKSSDEEIPTTEAQSLDSKKKTPAGKLQSPKTVKSPKSIRVPQKTPSAIIQSSKLLKKTPAGNKLKSPKPTRPTNKTPKSVKKDTQKTPAADESSKRVPVSSKKSHVTSTPLKTIEQITNKSFYGTPRETPIRNDDLIVFSAQPASSAKSRQKKVTVTQTVASAKNPKSTPRRMPAKKTPAVKRQIVETEDDSTPLKSKLRKIEKEEQKSVRKIVRKAQENIKESDETVEKVKVQLSPVEMSTVLKSVHQQEKQEKRKASDSPSPRHSKLAKITVDSLTTTPRVMKMARRTSPKKLAEIVERNQSNTADWYSEADSSFLNETVNTDSRSGRCVIL